MYTLVPFTYAPLNHKSEMALNDNFLNFHKYAV